MSWSTGEFTIGPRGRMWVWFSWDGADKGPQWALPHPLPGEPPTRLSVSEFSKILDYEVAGATGAGGLVFQPEDSRYAYYLIVTNHGDETVTFTLQGGEAG